MLGDSRGAAALGIVICLTACGDDDMSMTREGDKLEDAGGAGGAASEQADAQTPPQGVDAIEAWLNSGVYKEWSCESSVHPSRDPSPHGFK